MESRARRRARAAALVAGSFVAMEPVAYLAHRAVMHGRRGSGWHVSHHQARRSRFEANDLYPVVAAGTTIAAIAVGTSRTRLRPLAWVGAGVTLYGAAYLFVHDIYIHRRLRLVSSQPVVLERLREAHRIHHLWGGEPYGFLFPIVPADLAERARTVTRDPLLVAGAAH